MGALNGALVCMGDIKKAEKIWEEMTFSTVMDVDDEVMEAFFNQGWVSSYSHPFIQIYFSF